MENRGIEIAQKKARHRVSNQGGRGAAKQHLVTNGRRSDKPIFFTTPDLNSHPARFPPDVILAPRPINSTSLLVLALATPAARPTPAAAPDAKACTAAAPRKRARTSPATARKTRKKAAKPGARRPKSADKRTKTAKPKTKAASAAEAAPPTKPRARTRKAPADTRRTRRRTAAAMERAAPTNGADTPILLLAPPPADPVTIAPASAMADTAHADTPADTHVDTHFDTMVTPLPRAQTVALYRKGNLFDIIGYWCRAGWAGLARSLRARRRLHWPGQR